jgi:hypothetical protein
MPAQTVIKLRRDTAANWTSTNPILAAGEEGYETDTGSRKIGNGTTAWNSLDYIRAESLVYKVRNNTGSTILKGTLVGAAGAEPSGRIDVVPFEVTGLQDSELLVMGVAISNISSGSNGNVINFGTITGLDTRGNVASALAVGDETWAEGDILYAHPTVDGKLTKVRPQHDLAVAFITVRHASSGQIAVRIVPGNFHLEWLHDVSISSPADSEVLAYDNTSGLWINQTASEAGLAAASHTHIISNVTGLQDALDAKQATITGAATTITSSNLTASRALASDGSGKVAVSAVTSTELGYLSGVTSAIQTQLNAKQPLGETVSDKSAAYSIVAGDIYTTIRLTGSTGRIFTIDNVMTANGQYINFAQYGTGQITFAAGSGVTLNSVDGKLKTNKQYSGASVMRVASGVYWLFGDLAT